MCALQIQYKEGICKRCDQPKLIVHKSLGLCQYCLRIVKAEEQIERHKDKPRKEYKPLKRTPIRSVSKKGRNVVKKDEEIYGILWETKAHVCEECGCGLGDEPRRYYFSHILSKGAHPKLRAELKNFNILCLKDHQEWEVGDRESMKIWEKNKKVIEELEAIERGETVI